MVTCIPCKIKCKGCGARFRGVKMIGGIVFQVRLSPEVCPECGSKNIKEVTLLDRIIDLF